MLSEAWLAYHNTLDGLDTEIVLLKKVLNFSDSFNDYFEVALEDISDELTIAAIKKAIPLAQRKRQLRRLNDYFLEYITSEIYKTILDRQAELSDEISLEDYLADFDDAMFGSEEKEEAFQSILTIIVFFYLYFCVLSHNKV